MKPLLYLEYRQFINSIKNTARSPKRLIPTLIFGAWMISWFLQNILLFSGATDASRHAPYQALAQLPIDLIKLAVFLFLSLGSIAVLYNAFSTGQLVFSIAQIDFMFPTPISRKKVIAVKLLKDYLKYGFYVAVFFVFIGSPLFGAFGASVFPWGLISIAAITALLLTIINLATTINIIFTFGYERFRQAGIIIKFLLIAPFAIAVIFAIYQYLTTGLSYISILTVGNTPVVSYIFAPVKWTSTLFLAPLLGVNYEGWTHLALLWILAGGSLGLLMSRKENVYEPSLGISMNYAKRRSAMRSGDYAGVRIDKLREKGAKQAAGLSIPAFGQGAMSLIWKNMLLRYRVSRNQLVIMAVLPVVLVYVIKYFVGADASDFLHYAPIALLYIVWILSMTAQAEIRAELKQANILKSMPIASWKVMFAQIISATIYLTAGLGVFALSIWALLPQARGELLNSCVIGAISIGFVNVSAMAISSLLYPETKDFSQNYLAGFIGFLLVSLAIFPTLVIGGTFLYFFHASLYKTVAIITLANIIVGAANVTIAGAVFRKFDPTSE